MKIRRVATPGKLKAEMHETLAALDASLFPEDEPYPKDGSYWWVAEDNDGQAVGFAGLKKLATVPGAAFLCRCGVLQQGRGLGLQRRFMWARERQAKRLGVERLVSYTARENYQSANNFIACGYKLRSPWAEWVSGPGALYFEKKLT